MEDGAFEEDDEDLDEEEEEEEEEEDSDDVSRFATAGIDAIARKQVRASCHDGSARSACVSLRLIIASLCGTDAGCHAAHHGGDAAQQ
jgi:hypothetical protein